MKRCPQCNRVETDEALKFCRTDGTPLVISAPLDPESATMALPGSRPLVHPSGAVISRIIKRHKVSVALIGVASLIMFAGFSYGVYRLIRTFITTKTPRSTSNLKTQRLTGDGKTRSAVISPDGKFLVYRRAENDKESLWIKQIQTNSTVQVVKPGELVRIFFLAFSPDANFVYFNGEGETSELPVVYRVPTLGGTPVKVLTNAHNIQFSPDGKRISFLRYDSANKEHALNVANVDGSNERKLALRTGTQAFYSNPAWSPDGKTIAVTVGDDNLLPNPTVKVVLISVADGRESDLGTTRFAYINDLAWHPTRDSLIAQGGDLSTSPSQLWEISYPAGEFRRITNNLNEYAGVSITSDGNAIVTRERQSKSSIWVSPNLDPNNAKPVMPATADTWGFAWTPDNRVVYSSDQGGDPEIWIMNSDGSAAKPLTSDRTQKSEPVVSPDGRSIVYVSAAGGSQLVKIDINGGNAMVLRRGNYSDHPDISPDGKWVIYSSWVGGDSMIFRIPIEGGEPLRLTDYISYAPRYSPDGSTFACFIFDEKTQKWNRLAIFPSDGGQPIKVLDVPAATNTTLGGPVWTPDGLGLTVLIARGEQMNLWLQPLDGGPIRQLTNYDVPGVARRNYSRDGKQIAIVRAEAISNAVMITDFR
jgi:Tol biopolymer transport system component